MHIKMIINRFEIGNGHFGQLQHRVRVVDHITAKLLRIGPGSNTIMTRMQICVAFQKLPCTTGQGTAVKALMHRNRVSEITIFR